jgi:hypothetical protein
MTFVGRAATVAPARAHGMEGVCASWGTVASKAVGDGGNLPDSSGDGP